MEAFELTKNPDLGIFDRQFPVIFDDPIYDPTKMTIIQGTDGVLDDLFSYQVYNKLKNHWRLATEPPDKQPGMIRSDSDDDKLHHYGNVGGAAWDEVLQLTRSSDVIPHFDAVRIRDTGLDHYLELRCNEDLGANRILNFVVGNAQRTLTLSGNPTLGDWFDQSVKQAVSPIFAGLNIGQYIYHNGDVDTYVRFQTDNITLRAGGVDFINMVEAATDYLALLNGLNFIGDSANTDMTVGLTINQAGNDDEILAFKSSDVNHLMTDLAETDTYGCFKKASAAEGGLGIDSLTEGNYSLYVRAIVTADNTDHDATALAPFVFQAGKKLGAGIGVMGADANLAVFRNHLTGVWVLDEDGDTWQSGDISAVGIGLSGNITMSSATSLLQGGAKLSLEAGATGVYSITIHDDTTVATPNVYISAGSHLQRDTSSKKYKDKIKNLELDPALIYDFLPRSFNSLCRDDDNERRYIGLVAEEVKQVCPEIIDYGENNEVRNYDTKMLVTLILAETQRHEARIKALEAQLIN